MEKCHSNSSYTPTTNSKEGEVEWFYEDLQDLLDLTHTHTHTHNVLFIIRDWNAKVGNQEISAVLGKFGLEEQSGPGKG